MRPRLARHHRTLADAPWLGMWTAPFGSSDVHHAAREGSGPSAPKPPQVRSTDRVSLLDPRAQTEHALLTERRSDDL